MAYFLYGIMQAGSELGWHLSGPHFSREDDSSLFSAINIFAVGIRGMIFPLFGYVVYWHFGSITGLIVAFSMCLLGSGLFLFGRVQSVEKITII